MINRLWIASLSVLAPVLSAVPLLAAESPPFQAVSGGTVACPMRLPPNEIEGETIICGEIQVPENWDDPNSPLITLSYARRISTSPNPEPDPIFFSTGGPGISALTNQGNPKYDFSFLRDTRDVIVWDQRGTRYSSDLRCPLNFLFPSPEAIAAADAARGAEPNSTLDGTASPEALVAWRLASAESQLAVDCTAYLQDQGRDLSQYSTQNNLRDAIALMDHLGAPAYNLYAISYGTQLTLTVMDYYHQNPTESLPAVRSAAIDGVFPPNFPFYEGQYYYADARNFLRYFANCEADAACAVAYPNVQQQAVDLFNQLLAAPIILDDETTLTHTDLIDTLSLGFGDPTSVAYMPRLIAELAQGQSATYQALQAQAQQLGATMAAAAATPPEALGPVVPISASDSPVLPLLTQVERYLQVISPSDRNSFALAAADHLHKPKFGEVGRQGLQALIEKLPSAATPELLPMIEQLSDIELQVTWVHLLADDYLLPMIALNPTTNGAVICNDRAPNIDIAQAFAAYRASEYRPFFRERFGFVAGHEVDCYELGLAVEDYSPPAPPAESDLPTLVMGGGVDENTSVEWGLLAAETLPNTTTVVIPLAGHGTVRYSACARDITAAFFTDPNSLPDTSCIADEQSDYVLADEPLPEPTVTISD